MSKDKLPDDQTWGYLIHLDRVKNPDLARRAVRANQRRVEHENKVDGIVFNDEYQREMSGKGFPPERSN